MLDIYNFIPHYYNDKSRDFQVYTALLNILYNGIKTDIDAILNFPLSNNLDNKMLPLVSSTIMFDSRNFGNDPHLKAICQNFIAIVRNKGTRESIQTLVNIMLNVQDIREDTVINIDKRNATIDIYLPVDFKDIGLFERVLTYIIPSGYVFNIYNANVLDNPNYAVPVVYSGKQITAKFNTDSDLSQITIFDKEDGTPTTLTPDGINPTGETVSIPTGSTYVSVVTDFKSLINSNENEEGGQNNG